MNDHLLRFKKAALKDKKLTAFYAVTGVLAAIPIIVLLAGLIKYSVNVPWWDQMSFVNLMDKLHNGTLSIHDLWVQHNEHRIVVPQAFELIVGKVTGYNFRVPVLFNWITATASFGFLVSMLRRTFGNKKVVALLAVAVSWLVFSPIQYVNWIWGFQLLFFMGVFFMVFAVWLLAYKNVLTSYWLLVAVLLLATATTYCDGNGLLIWPIGLGILLWRRADIKRLAWWSGIGLVVIGSYLYKFQRSPDSPRLSMLIREPGAVIKYVLAYLGRNFAMTPVNGRYVGFVLCVLFAAATLYIYRKGKVDKILSWLGIAAYGLLTGVLAAISRLNFGIDHGFDSNSYPTISVLFIVATVVILAYAFALWMKEYNKKRLTVYLATFFTLGILVALPLPAFFSNYFSGESNLKALGLHLSQVQSCVYTATSDNNPCLLIVYPDKKIAWQYIQILKQLHWGDFKN